MRKPASTATGCTATTPITIISGWHYGYAHHSMRYGMPHHYGYRHVLRRYY